MAAQGLLEALNKLEGLAGSQPGAITVPGTFFAPGFWAAATLGLVLSGLGQYAFLVWLYRRQGAR